MMNTKIRREQLWQDRQSLDELLESDLFKALHEMYVSAIVREPPLFPTDELKLLNEVGYSVCWLQYHSDYSKEVNMEQLLRNAYATMGIEYYAHCVVCLTYAAVELVMFPAVYVGHQTKKELKKMVKQTWCGRYVMKLVGKLIREGIYFTETFSNYLKLIPLNDDFTPATVCSEDDWMPLLAAEGAAEGDAPQQGRTFTLDEIVADAKQYLTIEQACALTSMLNRLMVRDSTAQERELVNSIVIHIIQQGKATNIWQIEQLALGNGTTMNH